MMPLTLAVDMGDVMPLAVVGCGTVIMVIWLIMATIDSTVKTKAREATRRELAAYVAEGSMTSADAAQIMNSGKNAKGGGATPSEFRV